ncbi:MAG TPA: histidinol dehydrogenase, partial [Clostridiaceae bacterium]|nr:histidinol dehydrogenase [Clostridiaceae bacterium]
DDFRKKMSIIHYDEGSLDAVADTVERIALTEQLDCHARTISVRRAALNE